jgi:uncharacterized protein YdeI (YjbR/CyaY-like superfamily)
MQRSLPDVDARQARAQQFAGRRGAARNKFICWREDAKQQTTRERRIRRTQEELEEGQRRPCCWPGCKHRDRTGA